MFLSSVNSIINSTFFWITSAVFSACYCGWYAKKHEDSWGEWFVLGAFYPFFISIPAVIFCTKPVKVERLLTAGYLAKSALTCATPHTNCRVTRHLPTTSIHKHGRPAETEPAATIYAQGIKVATKFEGVRIFV